MSTLSFIFISLVTASLVAPRPPSFSPSTSPEIACVPHGGQTPSRLTLMIDWVVTQQTASCFFFSGPLNVGRDTHLGATAQLSLFGAQVTLTFSDSIRFSGELVDGRLELSRHAAYSDSGETWKVTERIRGTLTGNTLVATYTYNECPSTAATCPSHCAVSAVVRGCGITP